MKRGNAALSVHVVSNEQRGPCAGVDNVQQVLFWAADVKMMFRYRGTQSKVIPTKDAELRQKTRGGRSEQGTTKPSRRR